MVSLVSFLFQPGACISKAGLVLSPSQSFLRFTPLTGNSGKKESFGGSVVALPFSGPFAEMALDNLYTKMLRIGK